MRLVASGAQESLSGLDDNARFRGVVMPHIDDAYRLAHWLTAIVRMPRMWCRMRHYAPSAPFESLPAAVPGLGF